MVYKYREVRGTFTALTPDTTDADEHPNIVPLSGSVVLTPRFSNGGISFAEMGHFDQPQVKSAAIEDGELKAVVVDEETGHLTRQALFLPVTDDERADQQWSYEASFPEVVRTDTGERVVIPAKRFIVDEGVEPLNLVAVATTKSPGVAITKGAPGAGLLDIVAEDGQLVFSWDNGNSTVIDMPVPEAIQGVGVEDATQPNVGAVAFTLTDGSTTSAVSLPPGPPGRDGANVLPGRTTVLSEAWQPDFVDIARQRSPYKTMTLTADSGGGLLVQCRAGVGAGEKDDRITYEITSGPRYRLVAEITEQSVERGSVYVPDPSDPYSVHDGDRRIDGSTVTIDGTWNTSTTWYTTEVGATWETTITTQEPGDEVFMSFFHDNRGGIWHIELMEDPSVSADVSTFSESAGTDANNRVFAVPEPGTYTLRGTFAGDDPANPPSGGTARGWLIRPDQDEVYYLVRVSTYVIEEAVLSPSASNKNWALRVTHPEVGVEEFFPWHGQAVETIMHEPEFFDQGRRINVSALTSGEPVEVGQLTMVQHIRCHNSASPDELIDVRTTDTIMADGTYRADGRIEVLHELVTTDQMYTAMLPFNPTELNTVVTSLRNSYPAGVDMAGQLSTRVHDEGLHSTSVAVVGDDPNVVAAVRFNAPEETRRMSLSDNFGDSWDVPMFIEHRSEELGKVYPRFGYVDGTVVPVGTVWRFSADYWLGRVPGIRHLIE